MLNLDLLFDSQDYVAIDPKDFVFASKEGGREYTDRLTGEVKTSKPYLMCFLKEDHKKRFRCGLNGHTIEELKKGECQMWMGMGGDGRPYAFLGFPDDAEDAVDLESL